MERYRSIVDNTSTIRDRNKLILESLSLNTVRFIAPPPAGIHLLYPQCFICILLYYMTMTGSDTGKIFFDDAPWGMEIQRIQKFKRSAVSPQVV
jgi:hypothetical protein